MAKEDKTMEDLHRIREKHYERTKTMPIRKVLADISKRASRIERKYNLDLTKVSG